MNENCPSLYRDNVRSEAQVAVRRHSVEQSIVIWTSGPLLPLPQNTGPSAYKREFRKFFPEESDQPNRKHLKLLTSEVLQ